MNKCICPICKKECNKAIWHDAVKRGNRAWVITSEVNYEAESDTFDLSDMINNEISKIDDFDENKEDLQLMSFYPNLFTKEDIKKINFGEEDIGATCINCRGYL